jgi:hypothetical protein
MRVGWFGINAAPDCYPRSFDPAPAGHASGIFALELVELRRL